MKQLFYRGAGGALLALLINYGIKVMGAFALLVFIRQRAHGMQNYFNAYYVPQPGGPGHHPNMYYSQLSKVRTLHLENGNKDVLGRSII